MAVRMDSLDLVSPLIKENTQEHWKRQTDAASIASLPYCREFCSRQVDRLASWIIKVLTDVLSACDHLQLLLCHLIAGQGSY